jgi:mono/diheme cytochrome c family protein
MKKLAILIGVALLSLAGAATRAAGPDPAEGRNLYDEHCAVCHGANGKGDGPLGAELKIRPADLTEISKRRAGKFPEVEVREIIDGRRKVRGHGGTEMPVWGRVFSRSTFGEVQVDAKLDALVAYLRTIQVGPQKVERAP